MSSIIVNSEMRTSGTPYDFTVTWNKNIFTRIPMSIKIIDGSIPSETEFLNESNNKF